MMFKDLDIGDVYMWSGILHIKISNKHDDKFYLKKEDLPHLEPNSFRLDKQHYCVALPYNTGCKLIKKAADFVEK